MLKFFDAAPDGLVMTQFDGRIVRANPAFVEMPSWAMRSRRAARCSIAGLAGPVWIFSVALANLRQNGAIKLFSTTLRGEHGVTSNVEVSASALDNGEDRPGFGFAIRNVEKRLSAASPSAQELPRSVAQLTELIGRVPLRDLVREATDVIEKLSIEAALGIDRRQSRVGGRNAGAEPAEFVRQAPAVRAGRTVRGRWARR